MRLAKQIASSFCRRRKAVTKVWVQTYYVANRFGNMQERQREYNGMLSIWDARIQADKFLRNLRQRGQPAHPQYDLEERGTP